jgi:hypothetical protein
MEGDEMNGRLGANIDEEALFEVLATANFAAPAVKTTGGMPAGVIESTEMGSIFRRFPTREIRMQDGRVQHVRFEG